MDYERFLFTNGFLITDVAVEDFVDETAAKTVSRWERRALGPYWLYRDPRLPAASHDNGAFSVLLLGTAVNPIDGLYSEAEIANRLGALYARSEDDFLDYLDDLVGRHVVVLATRHSLFVYPDACGMRTAFYDVGAASSTVASHASLVAAVGGQVESEFARRLIASADYSRGISYFPGLRTPYPRVRLLTPNTCLNVGNGTVARFFPRAPLQSRTPADVAGELADLLEREVQLLAQKRRLVVSLTAGIDSRTTLAATRKLQDQILYFTHVLDDRPDHAADAAFARKLCDDLGLHHVTIAAGGDDDEADFLAYREIWRTNTAGMRMDSTCRISWAYLRTLPRECMHLKSNISEVGRARRRMSRRDCSPATLATVYEIEARDPEVIGCFAEFLEATDARRALALGYDCYDLFYWEHRMGAWQGPAMLDDDPSHDTVMLCNSRRVLKLFLAASLKDRLQNRVHEAVISELWPELAGVPVNPRRGVRGLAKRVLPRHSKRLLLWAIGRPG